MWNIWNSLPLCSAYAELYHFLCKHCKSGLIKPPLLKPICWANQPLPNEWTSRCPWAVFNPAAYTEEHEWYFSATTGQTDAFWEQWFEELVRIMHRSEPERTHNFGFNSWCYPSQPSLTHVQCLPPGGLLNIWYTKWKRVLSVAKKERGE